MDIATLRNGPPLHREGLREHADAVRRAHKHRVAHESIAAEYFDTVPTDADEETKTEAAYRYVGEINAAHANFTREFDRATDELFEKVAGKSMDEWQREITEKLLAMNVQSFGADADTNEIIAYGNDGEPVDTAEVKEDILEVLALMGSVPGVIPPAITELADKLRVEFYAEHPEKAPRGPNVNEDLSFLEGIDWEADAPEPVRDFDGGIG